MIRKPSSLSFKVLLSGAAGAAFFMGVSVLPAVGAQTAALEALRAGDGQIIVMRAGRGGGRGGGARGGSVHRGGAVHRGGYRGGVAYRGGAVVRRGAVVGGGYYGGSCDPNYEDCGGGYYGGGGVYRGGAVVRGGAAYRGGAARRGGAHVSHHRGGGGRGGGGRGGGRRSDLRLKHDVALLGRLDDGLGFYRFAYNGSDKEYVGVIAQEVLAKVPGAVTRGSDGYLRVFYDKLGVKFQPYAQWIAAGAHIPSGPSVR
jgi:endosialidase-like protein